MLLVPLIAIVVFIFSAEFIFKYYTKRGSKTMGKSYRISIYLGSDSGPFKIYEGITDLSCENGQVSFSFNGKDIIIENMPVIVEQM